MTLFQVNIKKKVSRHVSTLVYKAHDAGHMRELKRRDWVLLMLGTQRLIGRIQQMACIMSRGQSYSCLWCSHVAHVTTEDANGHIRVRKADASPERFTLACCNSVSITVLSCRDRGEHYHYQYVW